MPTMQSAVVAGPQEFELREEERPRAAPGRVIVRVRNCGICGSDLHFYRGEIPAAQGLRMGHEIAGEVAEAGDGADLAAGTPVAIEPVEVCRECVYCRTGRYQLCGERKWLGTRLPGGFAEYIDVPAYMAHPLPDGLPFDVAALVEPLAVAVHGLRQVRVEAGERVLVLGSGTIGLMALLGAQAMGASDVFVTARYPHQQEAARSLGASHVIEANDDATAALNEAFAGRAPEVVVETVGGHADTLNQAVMLAQPGGRVSILGIYTAPVQLNTTIAVLNEVTLQGGMTYGRPGPLSDFEVALDIARRHVDEIRSIITHRVSLGEIARGFAIASDKTQQSIKVTVEMQ